MHKSVQVYKKKAGVLQGTTQIFGYHGIRQLGQDWLAKAKFQEGMSKMEKKSFKFKQN